MDVLRCAFLIVFAFGLSSGHDPPLNTTELNVVRGQNVLLKCKFEPSGEGDTLQWFHNGNPISVADSRRKVVGHYLSISHVKDSEDVGEYFCEVSYIDAFKETMKPISLHVHWLSSDASVVLWKPDKQKRITAGEHVSLKCVVDGSHPLKLDWLRNGERITSSDRIIIDDKTLTIKGVTPSDNGVYRCSGYNKAGVVKSLENYALTVPGDDWATIQVIPQDQVAVESAPAIFNCSYENADVLEWYFQETGPLENSTRHTLFLNGSLLVNTVKKVDEGMYACVGIRQESTAIPQKFTGVLSIAFLLDMNSSNLEPEVKTQVIPAGSRFELTCYPPNGYPAPTLYWENSLHEIIKKLGRVRNVNNTLIIERAIGSDTGNYSCKSENKAASRNISVELIVGNPPVIIKHPISQVVNESEEVRFECDFEGLKWPFTKVTWQKNKYMIPSKSLRFVIDEKKGTLYIPNSDADDVGQYVCIVNSTSFELIYSDPAILTVIENLKFRPVPISKNMELGMPNKIPCKAQGADPPKIKWLQYDDSGNVVPFPNNIHEINGTLHFTKVNRDNRGSYTCFATNSQGSINVTVNVEVVVFPKFVIFPKTPTTASEGSDFTVNCTAVGDPLPAVRWDAKHVDLKQNRFYTFDNGTLVIKNVQKTDKGVYGCTAGNSAGFNRTEMVLVVTEISDIRNISGTKTSKRMVIITFTLSIGYLVLVVAIMMWCQCQQDDEDTSESATGPEGTNQNGGSIVELNDTSVVVFANDREASEHRSDGDTTANSQITIRSQASKLGLSIAAFSRKHLGSMIEIGNGQFGKTYLARSLLDNSVVLVNVLDEIEEETFGELRRQLNILLHVQHDNLIKLIGTCREESPELVMLEYTEMGDLKQYLMSTRKSGYGLSRRRDHRRTPLTIKQSLNIAVQVCSAMERISEMRYIHKDIAARNCLITSELDVKLAFGSACKDLYAAEYFDIRNKPLPLRWLPKEVVAEDEYSTKSDVYSFACLVWEVFSKGELPFSKMANRDVLLGLEKGQLTWKLPKKMPIQLGELLHNCWSLSPADRPMFSEVKVGIVNVVNLVVSE